MPSDWLAAQPRWMTVALLLAVGAAGAILIFSIRAAIMRRNAARPGPPVRAARPRPPKQQIEVRGPAVDAGDVLRRQTATLDNKAARLELLIRQADERIVALTGAVSAAPGRRDTAPPDPAGRTTPAPALRPRPPDPLTLAVYERADSGLTTVEIARELDEHVGKVELILALRGPR